MPGKNKMVTQSPSSIKTENRQVLTGKSPTIVKPGMNVFHKEDANKGIMLDSIPLPKDSDKPPMMKPGGMQRSETFKTSNRADRWDSSDSQKFNTTPPGKVNAADVGKEKLSNIVIQIKNPGAVSTPVTSAMEARPSGLQPIRMGYSKAGAGLHMLKRGGHY